MGRTIVARKLICGVRELDYPVLDIDENGTILHIGTDERALREDRSILTPALFDIHFHGCRGIDIMNANPAEYTAVAEFLARHGVAQFLPTTVTAPMDFTFRALERIADAIEMPQNGRGATPLGIHVEGPFLSHAKRGMHPADALQRPSIDLFARMQEAARGHIRLVTLAPEPDAGPFADGEGYPSNTALELIGYLSAHGVRCSIGHTNATASEAIAAIEAGAVSVTHTFNAMRAFGHREPGVLGVALDDDRLYADLICDGVHVAPAAVRLWWKAKGPLRTILITDSLSGTGVDQREFLVGDTAVSIKDGRALVSADLRRGKETLAGSLLTLDRAVENLQHLAGVALAEAVCAASRNPAAMLGVSERTRIEAGSAANLARWDEKGALLETYIRGQQLRKDR